MALFCGLTMYIVSILENLEALVIYSLIRLSSLGYTLRSIRTVIGNHKYGIDVQTFRHKYSGCFTSTQAYFSSSHETPVAPHSSVSAPATHAPRPPLTAPSLQSYVLVSTRSHCCSLPIGYIYWSGSYWWRGHRAQFDKPLGHLRERRNAIIGDKAHAAGVPACTGHGSGFDRGVITEPRVFSITSGEGSGGAGSRIFCAGGFLLERREI